MKESTAAPAQHCYQIDFLRFIFTLAVVNFHNFLHADTLFERFRDIPLYQYMHAASARGYIFVDFFFILAGYFMMHGITARPDTTTPAFAKSRWARLWPMLAFGMLCYLVTSWFGWGGFDWRNNVLNLLLLQSTGMQTSWVNNGPAWFVSALFWGSLFYFYVIKHYSSRTVNLAIALITFLTMAVCVQMGGGRLIATTSPTQMFGPFNACLLRGLFGLGLGFLLYRAHPVLRRAANKIKDLPRMIIFGIAEIFALSILIYYGAFHPMSYGNDMFLLAVIMGLDALFLIGGGFVSRALNRRWFAYLGAASYGIYILQEIAFRFTDNVVLVHHDFVYAHPWLTWGISMVVVLAVGFAGHHIVKYITGRIKLWRGATKSISMSA